MRTISLVMGVLLTACGTKPEPLDLPADAWETGAPVGVRTVEVSGLTIEVWYPASDEVADVGPSSIPFDEFVSDSVQEVLGDIELPSLTTIAVRDAALRVPEQPYPVLLFSHGFGGMRVQSNDITTHLASRGYVVLSTDHAGRSLQDLLPCMFQPALEGCDFSGMGSDAGPFNLTTMLDWLAIANADDADPLFEAVDLDRVGAFGHSAGGGSVASALTSEPRIKAAIPMAGTGAIDVDVPVMVMAGTCDAIVEYSSLESAWSSMPNAGLARFRGAGHLAFSDICALDLGSFADEHLLPRDDVNAGFLTSLVELGTDGCPGEARVEPPSEDCADGYLDLEISQKSIRHLATRFFDEALSNGDPMALESVNTEVEWQTN